jgi:hypothetical protein
MQWCNSAKLTTMKLMSTLEWWALHSCATPRVQGQRQNLLLQPLAFSRPYKMTQLQLWVFRKAIVLFGGNVRQELGSPAPPPVQQGVSQWNESDVRLGSQANSCCCLFTLRLHLITQGKRKSCSQACCLYTKLKFQENKLYTKWCKA